MKLHRFKNDSDIKRLFQQELDRFPRIHANGQMRSMFCEFGAVMIRPRNEVRNRLTHLVFPETIFSIAQPDFKLGQHSERFYPRVTMLTDVWRKHLYFQLSSVFEEMEDHRRDISLVVAHKDTYFNKDIWEFIGPDDQARLSLMGFGPNMDERQWVKRINQCQEAFVKKLQHNRRSITMKVFPYKINQNGAVGCSDTFFFMPGFIVPVLLENCFTEMQGFYEIASAHIHPIKEPSGLAEKIADRIGVRTLHMTVSPNDVRYCRSSKALNNLLLSRHYGLTKDTGETFMSIVGVDLSGRVVGIKHVDFGLIENIEMMEELNDRTIKSIKSGRPDIGLIVEHYQYFNDPSISSDQMGSDIGQHVGDPDFIAE
ncbi:MAG: hypothetical protein AB7S78_12920 [Candidatus Omnitrophota bacterium]